MSINDFIPDHAAAVTPSDTVSQSGVALFVGGVGNVTLITEGGESVLFTAVPAGTILNLRFVRIMAAGTTATLMVRMMGSPVTPLNTVAPAVTGLTTLGSLLTCSTGTWVANPTSVYSYQWQRNGVDIVGQVAATHTIAAPTVAGNTLQCRVRATNPATPGIFTEQLSNSITVT